MDILNMATERKLNNFMRRLNRGKFLSFKATVLKLSDLLGGWNFTTNGNFQQNISKIILARPQRSQEHGV